MTALMKCRCAEVRSFFAADAKAAKKFDPTGTLDIRRDFIREMDRRWSHLRMLVIEAIDRNENLGLKSVNAATISNATRIYPSPAAGNDNVKAFQSWIDEAMRQAIFGFDGSWVVPYISRAADRALQRAADLLGREVETDEGRIQAVTSLTVVELQGVMEAVSQQAVRAVAAGHLSKQRPSQVARAAAAVINSVGKFRGRMLVNTMVVKMFTAATLDAFRSAGIKQVGTTPERLRIIKGAHGKTLARDSLVSDASKKQKMTQRNRQKAKAPSAKQMAKIRKQEEALQALEEVDVITAGDDSVCQECEDISNEGPYDINTAESLIPAHPNCRCAFVPVSDERFAAVEK